MFKKSAILVLSAILGLIISACSHQRPYYDPERSHLTPSGFKNPYVVQTPTEGELLGWALRIGRPLRNKLRAPFSPPTKPIDMKAIMSPQKNKIQVTWIGHASFLIQYKGKNILTDPVFSDRASPVTFLGPRRYVSPMIKIEELPPIDAVIISHNHYDHMDTDSLQALGNMPHYFVPLGIKPWLTKKGISAKQVTELDWWQKDHLGMLDFTLVPARHFSNRSLLD